MKHKSHLISKTGIPFGHLTTKCYIAKSGGCTGPDQMGLKPPNGRLCPNCIWQEYLCLIFVTFVAFVENIALNNYIGVASRLKVIT